MKLIIQIPCYNEAETLGVTIADLPSHIDGVDTIEYLIIDDGSKDGTAQVAKELGVNHIVKFKGNKGLAYGFMAGLDACLRLNADIIVNTDADNQYVGEDIAKLVQPLLDGTADMVIGQRPIMQTDHFSASKKVFQRLGSWTVRQVSGVDVPDAPSGFRAYSRECALKLNVINNYTYTMETIIQAGAQKMVVASVPIRTNAELRPSRLFKGNFQYMKRAGVTIIRSNMMYKPLKFFGTIGLIVFLIGMIVGIRFLVYYFSGAGAGHIQSLILAAVLLLIGFMTIIIALVADMIAGNRKILEDLQYRVRRMDYEGDEGR